MANAGLAIRINGWRANKGDDGQFSGSILLIAILKFLILLIVQLIFRCEYNTPI
jgi:hypothetical protein